MKKEGLLNSTAFRRAISSIQKRAEKQSDWSKLTDVFVRTDLWERANSPDSQLVLGRRGTGKTHLFRVFHEEAHSRDQLSIYVDCTRLGSGFSGLSIANDVIAAKYFSALLNQLGTDLLDHAIRMELPDAEQQDRIVSRLAEGLTPQIEGVNQGHASYNYRQIADSLEGIFRELGVDRDVCSLRARVRHEGDISNDLYAWL